VIEKPFKDAEDKLHSVDGLVSKDEREIAAHVRDRFETARNFLKEQRAISTRMLPVAK